MNLAQKLVEFGLSEKEARVYLALLELGEISVSQLAKQTSVNRSSCYPILESLIKKGLVSTSSHFGAKKYIAESPGKLFEISKDKLFDFNTLKSQVQSMIPELVGKDMEARFRPKIESYKGKDGVLAAFDDSLNSREKYLRVFSSASTLLKSFPSYLPLYMAKRLLKGVRLTGIHPYEEKPYAAMTSFMMPMKSIDDYTFIPQERFKFPADIAIYDQTVGYLSHENEQAVLIRSKEISNVIKAAFDLALVEAKRIIVKL